VDGRIVAAATEDSFARVPGIGYAQTGGFPYEAVRTCLELAGVAGSEINEVVVVADDGAGVAGRRGNARGTDSVNPDAPVRRLDAIEADAIQAATADPSASAVVVCGSNPPAIAVFARRNGGVGDRVDVAGADALIQSARGLSSRLGLDPADPFAALDRLSIGADAEYAKDISRVLRWDERASAVVADASEFADVVTRVSGDHAPALADVKSLNARVERTRRALAASFTARLAEIVSQVADRAVGRTGAGPVAVGGAAFGNARLNTELSRLMGRPVACAAVPETTGRALGAVASLSEPAAGLAIGPAFSEEDIKRTLDNCRLDYVYEPDWARLLTRVSRMLAQGKIVGWFQGPMAFGPRALGTRSILGDPSNRYSRQNLNEYLRDLPLDEPLPVAMAPSVGHKCFSHELVQGRGVVDVEILPEWRPSLAAALDWRHAIRLHGVTPAQAPRLCELLDLHAAATGTPGLIEANLAGRGEPIACSPRDAVRTVYSSAIDALVIGRFLLMKDYWLLRTQDK